jgi:hypothetical protein
VRPGLLRAITGLKPAPGFGLALPNIAYRPVNSETVALIARMTVKPDAARQRIIDATVTSLKAAGLWAKLEALWVLEAHDAQAAQRNWIADAFNLTPVNSPTFTVDRGYAGNGSSSYLNTGFNPSLGSIFTQNSGSFGYYLSAGTITGSNSAIGMGCSDASYATFLIPRSTGNAPRGRINSSATLDYGPGSLSTRLGFTGLTRTGSTVTNCWRNGSRSTTETTASSGRPNNNMYLLATNSSGSAAGWSGNQMAWAFVGAGLTTAEISDLRVIMSYYMTSIRYGMIDRVLADVTSLGLHRGAYANGDYAKYDVTSYNGGWYVCHTAGTSASNPDVNTTNFVYLPLATNESTFLYDDFSTNPGAAHLRATPEGYVWRTTGDGAGSAVVTSNYMTAAGNTYFFIRNLPFPISEIRTKVRWNAVDPINTLSVSPDPNFLSVTFKEMWHENWGETGVSATWWHDGQDGQTWTTGKINYGGGIIVPEDNASHELTEKLRGKFLVGYIDGHLGYVHCDDLIETLCGANAKSFFVQNHSADLGTERHERVIVKTAVIA